MRKHKIAIAAFVLLVAIYLVQSFAIPPETAALSKYQLTSSTAQLLKATFTLPLIAVWVLAMVGYIHFSRYALSIRDTPDGVAFEKLSDGMLALALWLPAYAVVQNISSFLWHQYPSITAGVIIISNFINAILLLAVTYLLWRGARHLLLANNMLQSNVSHWLLYATTVVVAAIFTYLIVVNPGGLTSPGNGAASFHLPTWLLVPYFVLPYTAVWYLGLQSTEFIHSYRKNVKGIIYKNALWYIANGIAFSTIAALTMRTLSAISAWLSSLTLKFILITMYALVLTVGIGYILTWIGSKKLQLIEKV